MANQGKR